MIGGGQPIDSGAHMLISPDSMDPEVSITSRLSTLFYLWGASLEFDDEKLKANGLEYDTVITTSEESWSAPFNNDVGQYLTDPKDLEQKERPIMAMITGQFPRVYTDAERPAWPTPQPQPGQPPMPQNDEPEGPVEPVAAAPGKLILLGGGALFRDDFVQNRQMRGNLELFMNSVDALALSEDLVHVRGNKPIDRLIDRPSDSARTFWKFVNYALVNMIVAGVGIGVAAARLTSRNRYTVSHTQ